MLEEIEASVKASRLLSELMLLQAHGRLSTRELAGRLQISQRTAHRDMEDLCYAGVPLIALRGAQGGWELARDWRTKVPGLDEAELRALLMAQPGALGDPHLVAAAERAFGKLMAAMPGSMQAQADSIRARVYVDPSGWRPFDEDLSQLPILQDAIARDRKLTFDYTRPGGETAPRTVEPFGLVCKQTVWYLVARAPAGMRTYRVSRIAHAVVLEMGFRRPKEFDLAAYWKTSTTQLEQAHRRVVATLALSPEAVASLSHWRSLAKAAKPFRGTLPEGWTVFEVEFEAMGEARFVTLGLGANVWVLSPAELRTAVLAEIERLKNRAPLAE